MSNNNAEIPYATFAIEGTVKDLKTRQSPYWLGNHEWYLIFHSLTIFQIPTNVEEVLLLKCNCVLPNDALSRVLGNVSSSNWSWEQFQPLHFIPIVAKTPKAEKQASLSQLNAERKPFFLSPFNP